jgi:8-oxo-dGTP pyrophosphatase MutT (NUDIX family)
MVPLIVRAQGMVHHRGQVALPGGSLERGETAWQAARRELHEELGVELDDAALAGGLSRLYVFASNFDVTPLVALVDRRPAFRPAAAEVDKLLEVPLVDLPDAANWDRGPVPLRGIVGCVPQFTWQGHVVWGASAMILAELRALL